MSGICAVVALDGAPVSAPLLHRLTAPLERRGPHRTGHWRAGPVALGHTLVATTPESLAEPLPLHHEASGCVITADARLDNRDELRATLGLDRAPAHAVGDATLILAAYLRWGIDAPAHLVGDFAFALWDSRNRTLVCARDRIGVRPLCWHHTPGRLVAVASEPRALLAHPGVPCRIHEARIADAIVGLEDADDASTCFEAIHRLPPAHRLVVSDGTPRVSRYWRPEPGDELRLASDAEYAEAFLERFTEAVRCRLRAAAPVAAMLSGGLDSGAVVAVAARLLAGVGEPPLDCWSGMSPAGTPCAESEAIRTAQQLPHRRPHAVHWDELARLQPELEALTWALDEPFDAHMTIFRAVYLAARNAGHTVVLDGGGGDVVFAAGPYLAHLLRQGRWPRALHEARGAARFWNGATSVPRLLAGAARTALATPALRRLRDDLAGPSLARRRAARAVATSFLTPAAAERLQLAARLARAATPPDVGGREGYPRDCARAIFAPHLAAGYERYARVAASCGVEPRDPFADHRVVTFCLHLPADQKTRDGWPKWLLRHALTGLLPDTLRWRRGKPHLGWDFTRAMHLLTRDRVLASLDDNAGHLAPWVDPARLRASVDRLRQGSLAEADELYELALLAEWLRSNSRRPDSCSGARGWGAPVGTSRVDGGTGRGTCDTSDSSSTRHRPHAPVVLHPRENRAHAVPAE